MQLAKPNRDKNRATTNRSDGWCNSCDSALVRDGQKCPVCKVLNGTKRHKKPYPVEAELDEY